MQLEDLQMLDIDSDSCKLVDYANTYTKIELEYSKLFDMELKREYMN